MSGFVDKAQVKICRVPTGLTLQDLMVSWHVMISIVRGTEMWIVKLTQHCDLEGIDQTQFCGVLFGSVLARN
jgi:hypothetical protein